MTEEIDSDLLDALTDLDDRALERFVASLSPHDLEALDYLLPADPKAVERAKIEAADGIAFLRRVVPDMMPLEPGPQHRMLVDLLPTGGPEGIRAALSAFRGGGKSTVATTGLPLLALVRRSHRFLVVIRETLPEAVSVVKGLRDYLAERPALIEAYPWIRPLPGEAGEIHTAGGAVILARGAHGAIRGLQRIVAGTVIRPDLVLADDVYDDQAARSDLQTGRLVEWILGTVGGLAGPASEAGESNLDLILIGTTIERGDLMSRALAGDEAFGSWRRARFPVFGLVADRDHAKGVDGHGVPDGPQVIVDTEGVATPIPVPEHAQPGDRVPCWPAGAPLTYVDRLTDPSAEIFLGSRVFAREYLLRPTAPGAALFDREHTAWVRNLRTRVEEATLRVERVAQGVDPAASTRDSADHTALVVTGLVRLGDVLDLDAEVADRKGVAVLHAERGRWTMLQLLDRAEAVADAFADLGIRVVFESQGAFLWGAQELRRRRKVAVRPVHAVGDKISRATPLSVWHEAGRLVADDELRGSRWDTEFHGFTGEGDDGDDLVDATVWAATYSTNAWRVGT